MRRRDRLGSMRTTARRHEDNFIESDVIAHRFGNEQMSVVDRIEAAAEDADVNVFKLS
jgi:hypothetical protein